MFGSFVGCFYSRDMVLQNTLQFLLQNFLVSFDSDATWWMHSCCLCFCVWGITWPFCTTVLSFVARYSSCIFPLFITDRISGKCNAIDRVRLSVRLFPLRLLNKLTYDLTFCIGHEHARRDWQSRSQVKVNAKCVCYMSIYCNMLWVLTDGRNSRFSLWRYQPRASTARRATWRGRRQRQRQSPASVGVVMRSVWPRSSIEDSFHSFSMQFTFVSKPETIIFTLVYIFLQIFSQTAKSILQYAHFKEIFQGHSGRNIISFTFCKIILNICETVSIFSAMGGECDVPLCPVDIFLALLYKLFICFCRK